MQGVPTVASSVVPAAEVAGSACQTFPADDVTALHEVLARLMGDESAFSELSDEAATIRKHMLDRSLGWGSCLARVLTA